MVQRLLKLSKEQSFFLFGARGTGKSTLIENTPFLKNALYFDLLDLDLEEELSLNPALFAQRVAAAPKGSWVVVDEIQKIPSLLDSVHSLMEKKKFKFALTGSSSRKLRRGGANLLAGRAVIFSLFPFTHLELGDQFNLDETLSWGSLPRLVELTEDIEKSRFLKSYVQTYVKEEIVVEQLIRNLEPFRLFLPIAAQMDGQILNYSNISRDTGVDYKTIQNYYQILVETNLGQFLENYSRSVRKVQIQAPKFYFFDNGVKRALEKKLTTQLTAQTSEYGNAFESWFVTECFRMNSYFELDYSLSYLKTKDDVEIDLIIERPDGTIALVEIKSSTHIDERHIRSLLHFKKDFPKAQLICVARVSQAQNIDGVSVLPWKEAFTELGF
jgi:predicted AAA+ superfamily ATPase